MVAREISVRTSTVGVLLVRFLDDPGSIKLPLPPAHLLVRSNYLLLFSQRSTVVGYPF